MADITLLQTSAVEDTLGTVIDLKYSTGNGYNLDGYYDPVIDEETLGLTLEQSVLEGLEKLGAGRTENGAIVLNNVDGRLDDLPKHGFGRDAFYRKGDDTLGIGTFDTLNTGRISHAFRRGDDIVLAWRDRMTELDSFVQQKTYAEGYAGYPTLLARLTSDIEDKKPPRASGKPQHIRPEFIDPSDRIAAWNHTSQGVPTATQSVQSVYVGGVLWQPGTLHTTLAAFLSATPSQGFYDLYLPLSLIKMGGSLPANPLSYPITMNVTIGASVAANAVPDQWEFWALDAGVPGANISSADLATLNTDAQFECGIYTQPNDRYRDVMNRLAQSIFAVYLTDNGGVYRIKQMKPPQGSPSKTIRLPGLGKALKATDAQLITIRAITQSGLDKAVPIKELAVEYCPNYTPHREADLDDAEISETLKSFLLNEYRQTAVKIDAGMQTKYSNAREVEPLRTVLNNKLDAETIRDLAFSLWGYPRQQREAEVVLEDVSKDIAIGDEVRIYHDEYALDGGVDMVVRRIKKTQENIIFLGLFE